jgi:hypothetical protein
VLGTGAGNRGLVWCWLGVLVTVGISGMGKVVAAIAAQYGCAPYTGRRPRPVKGIQHDYATRPFPAARSLIPHRGTTALESDHRVSAILPSSLVGPLQRSSSPLSRLNAPGEDQGCQHRLVGTR